MPRTTGEDTRAAIRAVALEEFSTRGRDVPLDDIAQALGITRSAILHHFGSKAALSQEIVTEFQVALDEVLDSYEGATPPLPRERRNELLAQFVQVYCDHRKVIIMILRDIPGNWPRIAERILRLVQLLAGDTPTTDNRIIVDAIIGVVVRPLLDPAVDVDHQDTRDLLAAMAAQLAERLDRSDGSSSSQPETD